MICTLEELRRKEVIDIETGERLGFIDDVRIDLSTSEVLELVIYGRFRILGIFGRDTDTVIPCSDIKVVGSEVILIEHARKPEQTKSPKCQTGSTVFARPRFCGLVRSCERCPQAKRAGGLI